jgi:hypothetical protein
MMNTGVVNEIVDAAKYPNFDPSIWRIHFESGVNRQLGQSGSRKGVLIARRTFARENDKSTALNRIGFLFPVLTSFFPYSENIVTNILGSIEKSQGSDIGCRVMPNVGENKSKRETNTESFDILKGACDNQISLDPRSFLIAQDTKLSVSDTPLFYSNIGIYDGRTGEGGGKKELDQAVCGKSSPWPGLLMIGVGGTAIFISGWLWVLGNSVGRRVGSIATFITGCAIVGHGSNLLLDAEAAAASRSPFGASASCYRGFEDIRATAIDVHKFEFGDRQRPSPAITL